MMGRSQLETLAFCGGNLVLAFLLFALVYMTRRQIPQVCRFYRTFMFLSGKELEQYDTIRYNT